MPSPSRDEAEEQITLATEHDGRWPGMTYEQGVRDALLWMLGETYNPPMEDE